MTKRPIRIDDMYEFKYYSDPQISADGHKVLFVRTKLCKKTNGYVTSIGLWESGIGAKILVEEMGKLQNPRWIGEENAFLFSSDTTGKKQLYKFNIDTKEADKIAELSESVELFEVSKDGKKVTFLSPKKKQRIIGALEAVEITKLQYKADSSKGMKDVNSDIHAYLFDLCSKKVQQLTPDGFELEEPGWYSLSPLSFSPDAGMVAFVSRLSDARERDAHPWKSDIFVIDLSSGAIKTITKGNGVFVKPCFSSDGKSVYAYGHFNEHFRTTILSLYKINLETGEHEHCSEKLDRMLDNFNLNDSVTGYSPAMPVAASEEERIYCLVSDYGNVNLCSIDVSTGTAAAINSGKRVIHGFSLDKNTQKAAIVYTCETNPSAVAVIDVRTGQEEIIFDENAEFLSGVDISLPEPFTFESRDGMTMRGWIIKPSCYDGEKKLPTVLEVHGGPYTFYGHAFMFEFQLLAAAGMNVIYCNPRGSRGYGQKITSAIFNNFGKLDYDDIMRFTDRAIELYRIDKNRMGVTGGSYGGYMTNWIITQTQRFKAAVAQRSISNWMTMYGVSDMGYISPEQMYLGRKPNPVELLDNSPICYAANVTTPLLLLHSEKDMRTPIDQAEQMFVALKSMGKKVRFVRFPNSNHELSRSGLPSLREKRLQLITSFMTEHLLS